MDKKENFHCVACKSFFYDIPSLNIHMKEKSEYHKRWESLNSRALLTTVKDINGKWVKFSAGKSLNFIGLTFSCHLCPETFTCKGDLVIHKRIHDDENPFKCDVCDATFASKGLYTSHKIMHISKCSFCSLSFADKNDLQIHIKSRHYKCHICKHNFDSMNAVTQHLIEQHDYCYLCNKVLKKNKTLHVRMHTKEKFPILTTKQQLFKIYLECTEPELKKRKDNNSKPSKAKTEEKPIKICLKCNSELNEGHICMNEDDLSCLKCDVKFDNKHAFILHKKKHFLFLHRKFCYDCKKYIKIKDKSSSHKCSNINKGIDHESLNSTTTIVSNIQSDDVDLEKQSNDQSNVEDDSNNGLILTKDVVDTMSKCKGFVPFKTPMFFDTSDIYYL